MKYLKNILVFIIFLAAIQLSTSYLSNNTMMWVMTLLIVFFIFNILVRNSLYFKKYFSSPYNISTAKSLNIKEIDIPKELLFEKMIEVINDSNLRLVEVDEKSFEILATTSMNLHSWGENIYLSFESKGEKTMMRICSTTLFQRISWGKNKKNFDNLIQQIDDSLTI